MLSLSSRLISPLFMVISLIADSSLGLQADDDPSSSLASETYGLFSNFPLANIEDGANLELPNPNVQPQQLEQSESSHGCSSYSNMNTNRRNRKLRLRRGDDTCGWNHQPGSDATPSWTDGIVPLRVGTYIAGGSLSDKWGVCGTQSSVVANSIPVCTPVNLADMTGDAITSLREGPFTDLLMARLYYPANPCRANDPGEALYCCHMVTYHGPNRNMQIFYTSYDFSGRVCQKVTKDPPAQVVRPFRK